MLWWERISLLREALGAARKRGQDLARAVFSFLCLGEGILSRDYGHLRLKAFVLNYVKKDV